MNDYINRSIDYLQRKRFALYFIAVIAPIAGEYMGIVAPGKGPFISIFAALVSAAYEIITQIDKKHSEVMNELKYHPGGIKCPIYIEKIKCPIHIKAEAIIGESEVDNKLLELVKSLGTNDEVYVTARNYDSSNDEYYDILKDKVQYNDIKLVRIVFLSRDEENESKHNKMLDDLNKWLKADIEWCDSVQKRHRYEIYCTILPYFYNCIYVRFFDETKNSIVIIGINEGIPYTGKSRSALYLEGSKNDMNETIGYQLADYVKSQVATTKYDGKKNVKTIFEDLKSKLT